MKPLDLACCVTKSFFPLGQTQSNCKTTRTQSDTHAGLNTGVPLSLPGSARAGHPREYVKQGNRIRNAEGANIQKGDASVSSGSRLITLGLVGKVTFAMGKRCGSGSSRLYRDSFSGNLNRAEEAGAKKRVGSGIWVRWWCQCRAKSEAITCTLWPTL